MTEPGRLQFMGSQRIEDSLATKIKNNKPLQELVNLCFPHLEYVYNSNSLMSMN